MDTLKDFLSKNAEAKAEHEKAISDAVEKATADLKARNEKAVGFTGTVYGSLVNAKALEVIKGEADMTVLEAMAGMVDVKSEQAKLDLAAKETAENGETAGEQKDSNTDEENYQAIKARNNGAS